MLEHTEKDFHQNPDMLALDDGGIQLAVIIGGVAEEVRFTAVAGFVAEDDLRDAENLAVVCSNPSGGEGAL